MPSVTVLTYGTFDLFHIGHVFLLRRLRDLGGRLVVGCSTDEFNAVKGKNTILPYDQRVEVLRSCRYVDDVFPETAWEQKREDVVRTEAGIFGMGDDWAGKFDHLSDIVKVVYLPRTQDVSTTEIRKLVNALHIEKLAELKAVVERLSTIMQRF